MSQAVGDDLVRSLVADGRQFARARSDFVKPVDVDRKPEPAADAIPLSNPPGISVIDRLCEEAARQEYEAEIARRLDVAAKLKAMKPDGT
jgi:hypothetical protein